MYSIDLSALTEFNEALVYGFEPESSPERLAGSLDIKHMIYPEFAQHTDMFNAYLFAQNEILPFIRSQGIVAVTPDKFLFWIKEIHKRMANTLLTTIGHQSGIYATDEVLRTHVGASFLNDLIFHFMRASPYETGDKFIAAMFEKYNLSPSDTKAFLVVMTKVKSMPLNILYPHQFKMEPGSPVSIEALFNLKKITPAYHRNLIDEADKKAINKIMQVCIPIFEIEGRMQAYAEKTLKIWQEIDPTDMDALSEFFSESFYEFTDIHPFGNGNGRTATCIMNIMLRTFNLPDILLREPGEKFEKNSAYSQAIDNINETRMLLAAHIKERVIATQQHPFANAERKKLIECRLMFADILLEISKAHPGFDINKKYYELQPEIPYSLVMSCSNDTQRGIVIVQWMLGEFASIKTELDKKIMSSVLSFLPYNDDIKTAVLKKLEAITGFTGWKASNRNGFAVWVENMDKEEVKKAVELLEKMQVMKVESMRRADTKVPVIKGTDINIRGLLAVEIEPQIPPANISEASCSYK